MSFQSSEVQKLQCCFKIVKVPTVVTNTYHYLKAKSVAQADTAMGLYNDVEAVSTLIKAFTRKTTDEILVMHCGSLRAVQVWNAYESFKLRSRLTYEYGKLISQNIIEKKYVLNNNYMKYLKWGAEMRVLNIEIAEIEALLLAHSDIQRAKIPARFFALAATVNPTTPKKVFIRPERIEEPQYSEDGG